MTTINVYFAHPKFKPEHVLVANTVLKFLKDQLPREYVVMDPFSYLPPIEGDREAKKKFSRLVLTTNMALLDTSDVILAIIDDRDMGVIWEMGYATARGTPVITMSAEDYDVNIMLGASVLLHVPNALEGIRDYQDITNLSVVTNPILDALTTVKLMKESMK